MHIAINAECRRGLRIIEEIPNIPLCRLAGYNGIGKSNAIKLLQLCTGSQPFSGDTPAWQSFRSQLVRAQIKVTGLRGADEITWQLSPKSWPTSPEPLGDLIGSIQIDGRSARPRDLSALLSVYHVIAAETPATVLADRVRAAHMEVTDWLSEPGNDRIADLDLILAEIQNRINVCDPDDFKRNAAAASEAQLVAHDLTSKVEEGRRRLSLMDKAIDVADKLERVRGRGPEMDAKIKELQARLDSIDLERQKLDEKVTKASARQHSDEEAKRKFNNAQKYLIRQEKALRECRSVLQRRAADVGVAPKRDALTAQRSTLGRRLKELHAQLPQVNATPMLMELLTHLTWKLEEAEQQDLGNAVLIESSSEYGEWTVARFKAACEHQISMLSDRAPSKDAEALEAIIEETRADLDAVAQALEQIEAYESVEQNFIKAQERLRRATSELPASTAQTLDELMALRNELDQQSRTVQNEYANLSHAKDMLGGGMTEGALSAELIQLCREADVPVVRVRGRRDRQRVELEEIERREITATHTADNARRGLEKQTAEISKVIEYLSREASLAWLRKAVPGGIKSIRDADPIEQAESLQDLAMRLESVRDSLRQAQTTVQGIGSALGDLSSNLRRPTDETPRDNLANSAARLWLAGEVRQWFDTELVRRALFDGGSDISLNPRNMTVSWNVDGELRERPLSAFSSGQQAFAYTQAQVANLDREEVPAQNRLIALDEFGSFLDSDRMQDLASYLSNRQTTAPQDQVLVILPLEAPPGQASEGHTDPRIESLERRGYFAEAFKP